MCCVRRSIAAATSAPCRSSACSPPDIRIYRDANLYGVFTELLGGEIQALAVLAGYDAPAAGQLLGRDGRAEADQREPLAVVGAAAAMGVVLTVWLPRWRPSERL